MPYVACVTQDLKTEFQVEVPAERLAEFIPAAIHCTGSWSEWPLEGLRILPFPVEKALAILAADRR